MRCFGSAPPLAATSPRIRLRRKADGFLLLTLCLFCAVPHASAFRNGVFFAPGVSRSARRCGTRGGFLTTRMSDESTKKSSSREPKLGDTAVLEDGQSEKCRIDGVYKAAKCVNPDCSKHKRQPRALSTLFIVEELTTDDGLQLTGQDLRDARYTSHSPTSLILL